MVNHLKIQTHRAKGKKASCLAFSSSSGVKRFSTYGVYGKVPATTTFKQRKNSFNYDKI